MSGPVDENVQALKIGAKLKDLREKRRLTLEDMTAKTKLSKDFLARVERGEAMPPVANLLALAKALDVAMGCFFQDEPSEAKIAVTRSGERSRIERRPHHRKGEVTYVYEALEAKKANKHMEPFLVEFPPLDTSEMVFVSHDGEEFIHLLEGRLEFRSTDRVEVLEPGDSIYFDSDVSHSLRCLTDRPARAVVVVWSKEG